MSTCCLIVKSHLFPLHRFSKEMNLIRLPTVVKFKVIILNVHLYCQNYNRSNSYFVYMYSLLEHINVAPSLEITIIFSCCAEMKFQYLNCFQMAVFVYWSITESMAIVVCCLAREKALGIANSDKSLCVSTLSSVSLKFKCGTYAFPHNLRNISMRQKGRILYGRYDR